MPGILRPHLKRDSTRRPNWRQTADTSRDIPNRLASLRRGFSFAQLRTGAGIVWSLDSIPRLRLDRGKPRFEQSPRLPGAGLRLPASGGGWHIPAALVETRLLDRHSHAPALRHVAAANGLRGPWGGAPAFVGLFLGVAGQIICYHIHGGSYCDIGGGHEVPSRQTGSVGWSGDHRPDCARRGLRLAGRRDATSTVKHCSVLPRRPRPT